MFSSMQSHGLHPRALSYLRLHVHGAPAPSGDCYQAGCPTLKAYPEPCQCILAAWVEVVLSRVAHRMCLGLRRITAL